MRYFILAGEASGDLHASNLMKELLKVDPNAVFSFTGGDLMASVGGKPVIHYREMAFMGIINVVLHARTIFRNFDLVQDAIVKFNPDVVILVDYPSFNLRIAKYVKKNAHFPVYYYIPPKLWAWKEYRIKSIKKYVDKVFTIFPFETAFYRKHKYNVEFVGNPTVDTITDELRRCHLSRIEFCKENELDVKPIIAILPGSRVQEIKNCLPEMIKGVSVFSDYQIVISGAPGVSPDFYSSLAGGFPVVFNQTYQLLNVASAAVVNSGTATLETALAKVPQVVVYYVFGSYITDILKKIVLKVKYISLVNLIADKEVVKELYASKFKASNIEKELRIILCDEDAKKRMVEEYAIIRTTLGDEGAAAIASQKIVAYLKK